MTERETVKVTRADVMAARLVLKADQQNGRETEPWIARLAKVSLPDPDVVTGLRETPALKRMLRSRVHRHEQKA